MKALQKKDDLTAQQRAFVEEYVRNGGHDTRAAIAAGYSERTADVQVAQSKTKGGFVSGHFRLAHTFDVSENWYLRPLVDVGLTYIHLDGFTETGAGTLNLVVSPSNETYADIRPGLEVGGEIKRGGTLIRPYARAGVIHFFSNTPSIDASFQSAPQGVSPFVVNSHFDQTMLDVLLGIDVLTDKGMALRASYSGQFSGSTTINSGSLRFSIDF